MPVPPWMTTACCSWPSGWAAACSRTARPWPPSAPVPPRCVTWRAVAPGSPAARRLRNSLRPLPSMMFPCGPAPSRPGPVRRQLRHFRLRPAGARLLPRLLRSRLRRSLRKGLLRRPCPRRGLPSAGRSRLRPSRPRKHLRRPRPCPCLRPSPRQREALRPAVPCCPHRPRPVRETTSGPFPQAGEREGRRQGGMAAVSGHAAMREGCPFAAGWIRPEFRQFHDSHISRQRGGVPSGGSPFSHAGQGSLGGPSRSAGMSRF